MLYTLDLLKWANGEFGPNGGMPAGNTSRQEDIPRNHSSCRGNLGWTVFGATTATGGIAAALLRLEGFSFSCGESRGCISEASRFDSFPSMHTDY